MTRRYEIIEKMVSDYGTGAFPKHRTVSYEVHDKKNPIKGPVRVKSTREGAEEAIHLLKVRARKKKND